MGLRFLAAVALLLLLAYFARNWLAQRRRPGGGKKQTPVAATVRCARCGAFVPRSVAIRQGDSFYCSAEHARDEQNGR